ncbi:MAG TPA: 50S ribosomal protein L10 [Candidatus Brocadiia bacterium]|nr:50S ribosomal protein L10 [Planctomycetota bacterium]MDO8092474.1 50S ribosomal protein L10 [Candidatus Brocadiales bacterium]
MASQLKQIMVSELASRYQNADSCVVLGFQGVKATDAHQIRKDLHEKHIVFDVVKNSAALLAFKKVGMEDAGKLLIGPTAIAIGGDDPASLAKKLKDWSKKIPAIKLRGGYVGGRLLTQQEIELLASLPSKEVLFTQLLIGIKTPMVRLVSAFSAPLRSLLIVLQAVRDKKQQEGS